MFPEYAVGINGRGTTIVGITIAMNEIGVGYINGALIWREAQTIWPAKTICHHSYVTRRRVKAVDKLGQNGLWTEALLVAVYWICEPNRAVRMYNYVIG